MIQSILTKAGALVSLAFCPRGDFTGLILLLAIPVAVLPFLFGIAGFFIAKKLRRRRWVGFLTSFMLPVAAYAAFYVYLITKI